MSTLSKYLFPFLFIICFQHCLVAQKHADRYLEQAISCVNKNELDSALIYFNTSIALYEKADSLKNWINAYKDYARAFRNRASDPLPKKSVSILIEINESSFWRQPQTHEEWDALVWLYGNIAYTLNYKLEEYARAVDYYELTADLHTSMIGEPDRYIINYVFKPLANLYNRLGDLSASKVYLQKCVNFFIEENHIEDAAKANSDLAMAQFFLGNKSKAEATILETMQYEGLSLETKVMLWGNLSRVQHELDKTHDAGKAINKAIQLLDTSIKTKQTPKKWMWLISLLISKAELYINEKKYEEGKLTLIAADSISAEHLQGYQPRDLMPLYSLMGKVNLEKKHYQFAIESYHKIISGIIDQFNPTSWRSQPDPAYFIAEYMLIDALTGKAETLHAWYKQSNDPEMLQIALECYELIFEVERLQRRAYRYESSKLFNVSDARNRSAKAIQLALELWNNVGDQQYKEKALAFAERSKSTLMLEAFYNSRAVSLAGLPDSILYKERAIQKAIADTEETLYSAKRDEATDSLIQILEMEVLNLKQEYTDWIEGLEKQYPRYYKLKYNLNTLSSTEIRNRLISGEQAFLEYFIGGEAIYIFLITINDFKVFELEKDFPLEDWVVELRENIEAFQFSNSDRSTLCESYNHLAYQLYSKLIKPLEADGLPEGLLIVPDGVLGFVPFDALLSDIPHQGCKFSNYPYLLQKYHIQYAYSATLQSGLLQRSVSNKKWIGFAPSFDGSNSFGKLTYNQLLVEGLQKNYGGKAYMNKEATISKLSEIADQYGLFHFATHAQANTEAGDFSFIVFSNGQGGYDSLFVKDIYLLPLQAEMAVLSACETAVGKLYQGEGIINLARSFLYAGANSVITTQWSINDATNRELMERFYNFLHKGYSKSEALRLAKQEQVKNGGMLHAHPAYWAAFAPIGNMRAVYHSTNNVLWYTVIGLILGVILTGRWFFVSKKS